MRRRGKYPTIVVDDSGRGMSPERLDEVARNLFKSAKAGDDRTLGEKAIGMLAFQQLANSTSSREKSVRTRPTSEAHSWRSKCDSVDPSPGRGRSRFDAEASVVLYNQDHPDYLMLKNDESGMLDYLATLVAKEYVVYNNPMAAPDELAEEMVRMIVRVRRHMR